MPTSPDTSQKPLVFTGELHPVGEPGSFVGRSRPSFAGQHPAVLDGKKRLTIPSRWRPDGKLDELYLIKSPARRCINAMPKEILQAMGAKAETLAGDPERHQNFKDFLFANAVICPVDSQGRMVLPDDFCRFAGLEKDVLLTGGDEKFDIWNPEAWQERERSIAPEGSTMLKRLGL